MRVPERVQALAQRQVHHECTCRLLAQRRRPSSSIHGCVENETINDSRLIGRSVWNSRWLLIIPAGTLHSDRNEGLERFINGALVGNQRDGNGVSDIKLFFQTYAYSGN